MHILALILGLLAALSVPCLAVLRCDRPTGGTGPDGRAEIPRHHDRDFGPG